ncbi:ribokinase [Lapidilactobacillus luobeiensis]|uniref:ribokinase n=1 Tax=Lapidilactobacillus luobeiensis TaxID=2950371 RepID=UPI0021C3CDD6|nr:ribokinase [Lapidilactobacillus luobeiensis]
MTNRVTVLGSINVDRILHIEKLPRPGETIKMSQLDLAAGGKGANQAVAAARSGAATTFIGAIGADAEGEMMLAKLAAEKIDVTQVAQDADAVTGQAYILLQAGGQNSIVINAGANAQVSAALVEKSSAALSQADFVITQFETPVTAAVAAFTQARAQGVVTILNPAPASEHSEDDLLRLTDVIAPNETESERLTGIKITDDTTLAASAAYFHQRGVKAVIITLGEQGAFFSYAGQQQHLPAFKVAAVDTTAAGDTFIGAMAARLKPDLSNLPAAMTYASQAAALTVQKLGAFPSIPATAAVNAFAARQGDC